MSEDSGIDDIHSTKSKNGCENKPVSNCSEAGPDVAECKPEEFKEASECSYSFLTIKCCLEFACSIA